MPQRAHRELAGPTPPDRIVGGGPGRDEQLCRRCGRILPAARRFCDCGADLARRIDDPGVRVPRPPSWWAEWTAHRRFRGAQRAAVGGAAVPYDVPLSPRTWIARVLLVLLVLVVLAAPAAVLLGVWLG